MERIHPSFACGSILSLIHIFHQQVGNRQERWRYALVPVWVMTYKGKNGKIYYYTINGQNGKVCGELPVDYKKLSLVSALITGRCV